MARGHGGAEVRVIVCGSRRWADRDMIRRALVEVGATVVIEGEAQGADTIAREIAEELSIPVETYPADWERYGKAAGPKRNARMLAEGRPDIVLAFPLPESNGTLDMVKKARAAGIRVVVLLDEATRRLSDPTSDGYIHVLPQHPRLPFCGPDWLPLST